MGNDDERQYGLSNSAAPDTKGDEGEDDDEPSGSDVSDAADTGADAAQSGADMWDEEDELDDAFRQERMAGVTLEASSHDCEHGGQRLLHVFTLPCKHACFGLRESKTVHTVRVHLCMCLCRELIRL